MNFSQLIAKYDTPVPRYTSYPTVPFWKETPTANEWVDHLSMALATQEASLSLYLHIPFCETLCTFCGCNQTITKNHEVEVPYIESLHQEFKLYLERVPKLKNRVLKELHLGGGTPTFLSPDSLKRLLIPILEQFQLSPTSGLSIEVDPRRTTKEHLQTLRSLGFNRIGLGVQDFNPNVQRLINRVQSFKETAFINDTARELGFSSINFDLIYGLPQQTVDIIQDTVKQTLSLRPDRLAFYSYAHVPWIRASQRLFTEDDLPKGNEKRELYEVSRKMFIEAGYNEIGMDHFALPNDKLWKAVVDKNLHRNFMGYSENKTDVQLGLGVSSISDSGNCFHQNEKNLKNYQAILARNELPTLRGHKLNAEDLIQRKLILELSTTWSVSIPEELMVSTQDFLKPMEDDELITYSGNRLIVLEKGRPFLRNVCVAFDLRLRAQTPQTKIFSQSI